MRRRSYEYSIVFLLGGLVFGTITLLQTASITPVLALLWSPTPTVTPTPTSTPTPTFTPTPTVTSSSTSTPTPSATATPSATSSVTPSPTSTPCAERCQMISRLYREVLGREPDPGGLDQLVRNTTLAPSDHHARELLCASPEGRARGCVPAAERVPTPVPRPVAAPQPPAAAVPQRIAVCSLVTDGIDVVGVVTGNASPPNPDCERWVVNAQERLRVEAARPSNICNALGALQAAISLLCRGARNLFYKAPFYVIQGLPAGKPGPIKTTCQGTLRSGNRYIVNDTGFETFGRLLCEGVAPLAR